MVTGRYVVPDCDKHAWRCSMIADLDADTLMYWCTVCAVHEWVPISGVVEAWLA